MQLQWTFIGCDKQQQERIEELWRHRQGELEGLAGIAGAAGSTQARISIEHHDDASPPWSAQIAVYLTDGVYFAESQGNAIEDVFDNVLAELSQRMAQRQQQAAPTAESRRDLRNLCDHLAKLRAEGRSRDFMGLLIPLLRTFSRYAKGELLSRERQDELPAGRTSLTDVLDEVTLRAWERFDRRPADQPLDLWLIQLIDQVIDEACQPIAEQSLQERREVIDDGSPRDAVLSEWTEQETELESIELSRLSTEEPGIQAWDELDVETKQARLDELFERLTRLQRQVIMLYAVKGFDLAEIADFQDRSVEEVQNDLRDAQANIRRMFQEQGLLDIEEDLERPRRSRR